MASRVVKFDITEALVRFGAHRSVRKVGKEVYAILRKGVPTIRRSWEKNYALGFEWVIRGLRDARSIKRFDYFFDHLYDFDTAGRIDLKPRLGKRSSRVVCRGPVPSV